MTRRVSAQKSRSILANGDCTTIDNEDLRRNLVVEFRECVNEGNAYIVFPRFNTWSGMRADTACTVSFENLKAVHFRPILICTSGFSSIYYGRKVRSLLLHNIAAPPIEVA